MLHAHGVKPSSGDWYLYKVESAQTLKVCEFWPFWQWIHKPRKEVENLLY